MRIGAKKRPFYRVVAVDERNKRTGAYLELLGTYNPLTEPKDIKLNQERIDYWIKQGAQLSDGFLRIIGKAPQRPPRKPKREKKAEPVPAQPAEASATEETPAEHLRGEVNVKQPTEHLGGGDKEAPSDTSEVNPQTSDEQNSSEVSEEAKQPDDEKPEEKP